MNSFSKFISFLLVCLLTSSLSFAESKIYFSSTGINNSGLYRVDLNGQNINVIFNSTVNGQHPGLLAIDDIGNKIYWTVPSFNKIMRSNLDGSNPQDFAVTATEPIGISIDPFTRNVYWTNTDGITRVKSINGGPIELMQQAGSVSIAVAPLSNSIFTNDATQDSINQQVLNPFNLNDFPTPLSLINNITLSILHRSGKIVHQTSNPDRVVLSDVANISPVEERFEIGDTTLLATASSFDELTIYYTLSNGKLGKNLIGSNVGVPIVNNPALYSPFGIALSCGSLAPDSDNDLVPNCADNCPNDSAKTQPLICGCGISEADSDNDGTLNCNDLCPSDNLKTSPGLCGCGVSDALVNNPVRCQPASASTPNPTATSTPSTNTPEPKIEILTKDTKITVPPSVVVNNRVVKIFLLKFSKAVLVSKPKDKKRNLKISFAKASKITFRYKVNIRSKSQKIKNVYNLSSKRNVLTVKNLPPGNYTVNYQAEILKDEKQVAKTNLSPTATFTIE